MTDSLLIENGTVLQTGKTPAVLPNHSVCIEAGRITKIAPRRDIKKFTGRHLDASGKLVLPGFINAHTHCYSVFALGLTKVRAATTFVGVLENLWWRLDSALTLEDCYYSALIALLDSIRHGTTTIIDHHSSPKAVSGSLTRIEKAVKETGLRACLCFEVSDRNGRQIARESLEENAAFIRHCQQSNDDRVKALFGLHAAFTLGNLTLERAAQLGHELRAGFHIHVAEAASDQTFSRRHHRMRVVSRLNQAGILGPQTIAAHCVHVDRNEMDLLAETQTAVIHNPQSNLNNAVGIADVVRMSQRNVLVGLGTDAMTANMLEELRTALWAQHLLVKNPSVGFAPVMAALFSNNPKIAKRIFNLPLGELREGCVGDVVLVEYDPPTPLRRENIFGHLVFGVSQAVVDTTIVGGRILMQNRRLKLDIDEARIHARARELAKKLWKRL